MPLLFDYLTLKIIWWLLVCVLLVGFALLDGFDLGVGTLLPFLARTDEQRRVLLNAIGPTWEGNQVWFITAGGAMFAAWPFVYATAFSGFYWAMLLVLFALFFRPWASNTAAKSPTPVGEMPGTGGCSSAGPCRRWSSGSPSATCSRGFL